MFGSSQGISLTEKIESMERNMAVLLHETWTFKHELKVERSTTKQERRKLVSLVKSMEVAFNCSKTSKSISTFSSSQSSSRGDIAGIQIESQTPAPNSRLPRRIDDAPVVINPIITYSPDKCGKWVGDNMKCEALELSKSAGDESAPQNFLKDADLMSNINKQGRFQIETLSHLSAKAK